MAGDWIRTQNLWSQNWPLYQLSHWNKVIIAIYKKVQIMPIGETAMCVCVIKLLIVGICKLLQKVEKGMHELKNWQFLPEFILSQYVARINSCIILTNKILTSCNYKR